MEKGRWVVRIAGAGIWLLAALTWGSIAHHLFGLPDVGPGAAVLAVMFVLAWPRLDTLRTQHSMKSRAMVDEGQPSRP